MPADDSKEQHDDLFEDRFARALQDAGAGFGPGRDLAAAGAARGRRLLARRRAAVLAGAAAVACAGVSGALLLPGAGGADDPRSVTAASTSTSPAGSSPAGSSSGSSPAGSSPAAGTVDAGITAEEMIRTLKDLLPEGTTSGEEGAGSERHPLPPYAGLVYDDGEGGGAISLSLNRVEPGSNQARETTTCPDKALVRHDACRTEKLADGSRLMLFQGYEYPDGRADTKWWAADLVTPQGHHVSVSEWNAEAQKDAPVTRDRPPLSMAQLRTVATAPAWRALAEVGPAPEKQAPPEGTDTPPADPSGKAIRRTLVSLLPDDVEVVDQGGQDTQYAFLVLDDGQGASLVQINVQADMSDVEDQLFGADAETLPDGTKVVERRGPGEKGGEGVVKWTVDTIRPDGRRVVISAFNSGAQHTDATRETPALTVEELRDIATDPRWRDVR
ncbi:hypothetical protein [Streptomyces sp. NPDC047130]|uniref:hypothetical protein n=1 Tax=Streptomyces sp. NPDC047130 TaxID=3155261 RepID=UPI0033EB9C94